MLITINVLTSGTDEDSSLQIERFVKISLRGVSINAKREHNIVGQYEMLMPDDQNMHAAGHFRLIFA